MRLLVVESDKDLSRITQIYLGKTCGHSVDCALNVDSALAMAAENTYDCILIEFRLPRSEMGLNLAKLLRDNGFEGIIIALVSQPHTFTVEKMREMGFNACVDKPMTGEKLEYLNMKPGTHRFDCDDLVFEKKPEQRHKS